MQPDVVDGSARTRAIVDAYRTLRRAATSGVTTSRVTTSGVTTSSVTTSSVTTSGAASDSDRIRNDGTANRARPKHPPSDDPPGARLDGPDTIVFDAPTHEAFSQLLAVAHDIGDVTYLDRDNELLEALLRTAGGTTLSMVITLQGRGNGTTEAFVTIEPLDVARGELPSVGDVTALVLAHLTGRGD